MFRCSSIGKLGRRRSRGFGCGEGGGGRAVMFRGLEPPQGITPSPRVAKFGPESFHRENNTRAAFWTAITIDLTRLFWCSTSETRRVWSCWGQIATEPNVFRIPFTYLKMLYPCTEEPMLSEFLSIVWHQDEQDPNLIAAAKLSCCLKAALFTG